MVDTTNPTRLETLLSASAIDARVRELAARIQHDYHGLPVTVLGVLKGSVFFLVDLLRCIDMPIRLEFVRAASYGAGTTSSGTVEITGFDASLVAGRHVLVVDDILDSGRTLRAIADRIAHARPASVKTCVLVDKRKVRAVEFEADYKAFEIDDVFIVGYGLDHAEQHRNLPYIARLIESASAAERSGA